MRGVAVAVVAIAVLLGPRIAAAQPAPVYSWSGFYLGGNIGYGWGNAQTSAVGSGTVAVFPAFPASFAFADSNTAPLGGAVGGVQVGYNYQFNPKWVFGLEADLQGSAQRGSNAFVDPFSTLVCNLEIVGGGCPPNAPVNGTATTDYQAKIAWFDTVRVRLGYLVTDQILLYGTGGLAYGRVQLSGTSTATGTGLFASDVLGPTAGAFSTSRTNAGFAVGGGMEARLWPSLPANWTWKLEYLYLDLGSLNAITAFGGTFTLSGVPLTEAVAVHTHFTDNVVRVGLNYQFGD